MKSGVPFAFVFAFASLALLGCSGNSASYSVLPSTESFKQVTASGAANNKVDMVWIVDNSASMAASQQNLTDNFPQFIAQFVAKSFDFKIAVTTTDAYLAGAEYNSFYVSYPFLFDAGQPQAEKAQFRDGAQGTHSGVFVILPSTPSLNTVFVTNASQSVYGYGDSRSFQSLSAALDSSLNDGFLRSDSFLAIVNISDEDDWSHSDGVTADDVKVRKDETYSGLMPPSDVVDYLDTKTNSTGSSRRYSFSNIGVQDQTCLNALKQINSTWDRYISTRSNALADLTGGQKLSICGDFATQLQGLSERILELATRFSLSRAPVISSIVVTIDGQSVPPAAGSVAGGWSYDSASNSILFSGQYIPGSGAVINVSFQPSSLNF